MLYARLRMIWRSLRFRLLAWNTVVVLLMVIPTLVAVREAMRHTLFQEFDRVLQNDIQEIQLALSQFATDPGRAHKFLTRKGQGHVHSGWFVRLVKNGDQEIWSNTTLPGLSLAPAGGPHNLMIGDTGYRLHDAPALVASEPDLQIQVGASLEGVNEDIALLTRMMVLAAALLLVLTPLGCYWLAGRATAPIAQIIRTTSQLRPSQLNERLPLRNTGDELDQLSQTINGLLDRLASFVNEKRDFLANAAHELRSPLAAIRSSVEVALNSKRSSEEYVVLLEEIMEECSDLGVLVNQLLLLTESEKADLGPPSGPIALDRVARRSFNMFQGVAEAEGLELTLTRVDNQIWVHGDEHHLQQVINNLVDNAIKFTPPSGKVQVEVRALADQGFALLQVSDTGMGIADENRGRIFERFYRGDHSRQRQGHQRGNGLGLAICHSIVTSLGGSITVQSQPGVGSTFRVMIPLAKP